MSTLLKAVVTSAIAAGVEFSFAAGVELFRFMSDPRGKRRIAQLEFELRLSRAMLQGTIDSGIDVACELGRANARLRQLELELKSEIEDQRTRDDYS